MLFSAFCFKRRSILQIAFTLCFMVLITSCVNLFAQDALRWAHQSNSIEGYQKFLSQYPDSKYTGWVNRKIQRMTNLKEGKNRNRIEANRKKNSMMEQYSIGLLTEEQFFADGWEASSPFYGILGVIGGERTDNSLTLIIGTYETGNLPRTINITLSNGGYGTSFVKTYPSHLSPKNIRELADDYRSTFKFMHSSNFSWDPLGQKFGELVFKENLLKSKSLTNKK